MTQICTLKEGSLPGLSGATMHMLLMMTHLQGRCKLLCDTCFLTD